MPIHIACNRGASIGVIKELLDKDKDVGTVREETRNGRRPLHLAIGRKMHHDIIKLLLDAEREYHAHKMRKEKRHDDAQGILDGKYVTNDHGIYNYYDGLLPLHMACLNGIETRTIRLLVMEDVKRIDNHSTSSSEHVGSSETKSLSSDGTTFPDPNTEKHYIFTKLNKENLPQRFGFLRDMRALQLCLFQEKVDYIEDNVRFLLEQEQCHNNRISEDDNEERTKCSLDTDVDQRTCLHVAVSNLYLPLISRIEVSN